MALSIPVRLGAAENALIEQLNSVGAHADAERITVAGLPTRRVESYHYTDLKMLLKAVPPLAQAGGLDAAFGVLGGSCLLTAVVVLAPYTMGQARLWHFDSPVMYSAQLALSSSAGEHSMEQSFGIRSFEARGTDFFLNGENVSLVGVERMAGSNPDFGMAETSDWIRRNHEDMKELNCTYTRVHWAQDRRVLDFCDRNGDKFRKVNFFLVRCKVVCDDVLEVDDEFELVEVDDSTKAVDVVVVVELVVVVSLLS